MNISNSVQNFAQLLNVEWVHYHDISLEKIPLLTAERVARVFKNWPRPIEEEVTSLLQRGYTITLLSDGMGTNQQYGTASIKSETDKFFSSKSTENILFALKTAIEDIKEQMGEKMIKQPTEVDIEFQEIRHRAGYLAFQKDADIILKGSVNPTVTVKLRNLEFSTDLDFPPPYLPLPEAPPATYQEEGSAASQGN